MASNSYSSMLKVPCSRNRCLLCHCTISTVDAFCSSKCKFEHGYYKLVRYAYKEDIPDGALLIMNKEREYNE